MTASSLQQIIDFGVQKPVTFASYFPGDNELVVNTLQSIAEGNALDTQICLWGNAQTGKTHLLQAVCEKANQSDRTSIYIPMVELLQFEIGILEGLDSFQIICVDDVEQIAGESRWERAFVQYIDTWRQAGVHLVTASAVNPARYDRFVLADVTSRLTWGAVHKLKPLKECEVREAIRQHGEVRGVELSDDVCDYLMTHYSRSLSDLLKLLDRIDLVSLQQQKKVNVTMIRKLLQAPVDSN